MFTLERFSGEFILTGTFLKVSVVPHDVGLRREKTSALPLLAGKQPHNSERNVKLASRGNLTTSKGQFMVWVASAHWSEARAV